jgi:cobyrinic acid a,c-diamide synthase
MFEYLGGVVKFFSPLEDAVVPSGTDWIYLPGVYPELFGEQLSKNEHLLTEIRNYS